MSKHARRRRYRARRRMDRQYAMWNARLRAAGGSIELGMYDAPNLSALIRRAVDAEVARIEENAGKR